MIIIKEKGKGKKEENYLQALQLFKNNICEECFTDMDGMRCG